MFLIMKNLIQQIAETWNKVLQNIGFMHELKKEQYVQCNW